MNVTAPFPLLLMALMVYTGLCTARPRPSLFSYFKGGRYSVLSATKDSSYSEKVAPEDRHVVLAADVNPGMTSSRQGLFYAGDSKETTSTTTAAMEPPVARATLDHDHVDAPVLKVALPAPHAAAGDHVHLRLPQLHHHAPAGHALDVHEPLPHHENDHRTLSLHSSGLHYG